ncbi:S8 family serine peptidase [Amycolatopsis sp. TNS106]|uniref:S8 family serine peptidase n=1 Tax=Amycolatopsis sp. TNS106 TaxID=2861750 RepID=UPI001C577AF1|nr:S8 family serine peptidase [Amycolatopsis sp. TNS106]QXV62608.1 peptidase S8 [Amycolatopsis sp. TNS106]
MAAFRHWRRRAALVVALLAVPAAGMVPAQAAGPLAPVAPGLSRLLSTATGATGMTALVHAGDIATAERAARAAGLEKITSFGKIGVVAVRGTADQVRAVRGAAGVTYVEGNEKLKAHGSAGTTATRSLQTQTQLKDAGGAPVDGRGVSVAIIDTGVDPTHPAFKGADGKTRVVRNLKSLCLNGPATNCIVDVPTSVDTDTLALGGHGTHVTGIAAGNQLTLSDGTKVGGSAPGSKIVSVSTGAALLVLGTDAALNWVLENHKAPCGAGVAASVCPPIKVTNNSYGPSGGGAFDPNSATVKLQRALAAEGVVTVWANGNDGGDGSANLSNPPGQDQTPGVLSAASFNDQGTGTRDGTVSDFSSRGLKTEQASWPDVSAPGENILSACRPTQPICTQGLQPKNGPGLLDLGTYNVISGTSMAAPQITGIVAQLFQVAPNASPGDIEAAIKGTAYKFAHGAPYVAAGPYTSSFDKGTGLVDTFAAAKSLGAQG